MEPSYEVLHQGETSGPWRWAQLKYGLRQGQFVPEDSFRKQGATQWRSLGKVIRRENRTAAAYVALWGLVFICLGIAYFRIGLIVIEESKASLAWPSEPGKITSSVVGDAPGHFNEPLIWYRYMHDGKMHFGTLVYPFCDSGSKERTQAIVDRHPEGSLCRVYHDPKRPWFTIIEPGLAPHSYHPLIMGEVFLWVAALLGLLAFRFAADKGTKPFTLKLRPLLFRMALWIIPPILAYKLSFWLP